MLRREELEKKDNIVRMKIEFASEIPEEPEPELENVVRVCIKLPGGQRLDRRWDIPHGQRSPSHILPSFQVSSLSLTEAYLLFRILPPGQSG